jgi:hypothetical protein
LLGLAQPIETKWRIWLRGVDLNHRPLGYEPNELPDCSTPQVDHSNRLRVRQTAIVNGEGLENGGHHRLSLAARRRAELGWNDVLCGPSYSLPSPQSPFTRRYRGNNETGLGLAAGH